MDMNEFPSSAFLINFTHLFLAQKQNLKHRYKGFHISEKKKKKIKNSLQQNGHFSGKIPNMNVKSKNLQRHINFCSDLFLLFHCNPIKTHELRTFELGTAKLKMSLE